MWFSKKSHVVLRISTCGFLKSHMWFYPRETGNVPKRGWNRTRLAEGVDQFEGLKVPRLGFIWYGEFGQVQLDHRCY